jgi:hypothetical protein
MAGILDAERFPLSEVARRLNVHVATCWRWARVGVRGRTLPTFLVGGRRFVLKRDLETFLAFGEMEPLLDDAHSDR